MRRRMKGSRKMKNWGADGGVWVRGNKRRDARSWTKEAYDGQGILNGLSRWALGFAGGEKTDGQVGSEIEKKGEDGNEAGRARAYVKT